MAELLEQGFIGSESVLEIECPSHEPTPTDADTAAQLGLAQQAENRLRQRRSTTEGHDQRVLTRPHVGCQRVLRIQNQRSTTGHRLKPTPRQGVGVAQGEMTGSALQECEQIAVVQALDVMNPLEID